MSFQTPADIAASYFTNIDQRNALRADIENLYDLKGAEIRAGCALVARANAAEDKSPAEIETAVNAMTLPDITVEP